MRIQPSGGPLGRDDGRVRSVCALLGLIVLPVSPFADSISRISANVCDFQSAPILRLPNNLLSARGSEEMRDVCHAQSPQGLEGCANGQMLGMFLAMFSTSVISCWRSAADRPGTTNSIDVGSLGLGFNVAPHTSTLIAPLTC